MSCYFPSCTLAGDADLELKQVFTIKPWNIMRSSGQVFLFDKFLVDIGTSSDLTLSCYNEDVLKAYKYYSCLL